MSVYENIITSLNEAVDYAKGKNTNARTETVTTAQAHEPETFGLSALDVAKWLIAYNNSQNNADYLTVLKLQKLLYYAQGVSIKYTGKTLFTEPIYAWQRGPVVAEVYNKYKRYGKKQIDEQTDLPEFGNNNVNAILQDVYEDYGQFSAWKLVDMTHEESPWKDTPIDSIITVGKMKAFFGR